MQKYFWMGVGFGAAILLTEGLLSFAAFGKRFFDTSPPTIRPHTQYDPELGWTLRPHVKTDNAFFNKKKLQTNSLALRGEREFSQVIPKGKKRVFCSGDSFTFGEEASDTETWCHLLEAMDPALETVNLGTSGYGIDQSFLRFKRISKNLNYDTHILAFITNDFDRMRRPQFAGHPKPLLSLKNGSLSIDNLPVPTLEASNRLFWLHSLTELRLGSVFWKVVSFASEQEEHSLPAAFSILEEILSQLEPRIPPHKLLLVHLPSGHDYLHSEESTFLRNWLKRNRKEKGDYLDLIGDFQNLSPLTVKAFFNGSLRSSHYSPMGNEWIARKVLEKL